MKRRHETGGSAFPTLRDYFAAAALTGLLMSDPDGTERDFADDAYKYADAMLRARGEPKVELE